MDTLNNTRKDNTLIAGNEKGMTLVELMIALVLFLIVIAGIYSTFTYQQGAYLQTEARVNMIQEARAAQFFLARDIKMAGYDPSTKARAGFDTAEVSEIGFSMDITRSGDSSDLQITNFALTTADGDIVDDGICPDGARCRLSREWCSDVDNCGGLQPIAEDVEALELCYIIGNVRMTTSPTSLESAKITSVIVSLLMKQAYRSNTYLNTDVYMPASGNLEFTPGLIGDRSEGWGPFNDSFHRKLIVFEVKARNMTMNPWIDAF